MEDVRECMFGGSSLDRVNNRRADPEFISGLCSNNTSEVNLVFNSSLEILCLDGSVSSLPREVTESSEDVGAPRLLLGCNSSGSPHFAVRLQKDINHIVFSGSFISVREAAATMSRGMGGIVAHARALFEFHARHRFCGTCGSRTVSEQGGGRRRCERNIAGADAATCRGLWFPRSDPVAIMLVVDNTGKRVLLGRQERFPPGMFSCLAGFMEHGEGVEDTVRREVCEESGVTVGRVRFFGSQPWPFPYSLMLGCIAQATEESITVDAHELQEARWFTRDEVVDMVQAWPSSTSITSVLKTPESEKSLFIPPVTSIAGQMCAAFAAGDPITSFATTKEAALTANGML